ncbi:MAG: OmpA family protein [Deltaproteobacteria bacterium]|nr:OmpA family protein [Deltaproteobacteria bacterium]
MKLRLSPPIAEEEDVTAFWLITYSDMVTLLLTFFLLIYSFTQFNEDDASELMRMLNDLARSRRVETHELVNMSRTADEIKEAVAPDPTHDQPLVQVSETEVRLVLPAELTFGSGEATLTESAQAHLLAMAERLVSFPGRIRIEGHTDNVPMRSALIPSNWHLSAARAQAVARLFIAAGLKPTAIEVVGYGDARPVADNDDPEGRRQNRRTEIKLLQPADSAGRKDAAAAPQ